jgi:hypothetical protein
VAFAREDEAEEQDAIHRWLDLAARRAERASAIEAKLGPLDDAERERLRAYDEPHVIEAERRLPAASTLDHLDGELP